MGDLRRENEYKMTAIIQDLFDASFIKFKTKLGTKAVRMTFV